VSHDYDRDDVVRALREVGLRAGDTVFSHAGVAMLGRPAEGLTREAIATLFRSAFAEVLGPDGTLVLPAFTYSATSGELFDPATTPPTAGMGVLSEELWPSADARSLDPIFSVIALGGGAQELVDGLRLDDAFGPDSIWGRLLDLDAAICNIGIGSHSTLIHRVEQQLGVPYRYVKSFPYRVQAGDAVREGTIAYNVRPLDDAAKVPYFMRLDAAGRENGTVRAARVGRGEINLVRAQAMATTIRAGLDRDPDFLVRGADG
jgi:aminoglycoside 3-N-acetyltransferase